MEGNMETICPKFPPSADCLPECENLIPVKGGRWMCAIEGQITHKPILDELVAEKEG